MEIPLFTGDDPIGWLQQCEKFFDMSGTPYEQWVNISIGHFFGRANVWLKNIYLPWQSINWQEFCQLIADRFTQTNAHEVVELLKKYNNKLLSVLTLIVLKSVCAASKKGSSIPPRAIYYELFYWWFET